MVGIFIITTFLPPLRYEHFNSATLTGGGGNLHGEKWLSEKSGRKNFPLISLLQFLGPVQDFSVKFKKVAFPLVNA